MADVDRTLLRLRSEYEVLGQHRDDGRNLLLACHVNLCGVRLKLVGDFVVDTRQQRHKVELTAELLHHSVQRLNEPRTLHGVTPREVACQRQNTLVTGEEHAESTDQTYADVNPVWIRTPDDFQNLAWTFVVQRYTYDKIYTRTWRYEPQCGTHSTLK